MRIPALFAVSLAACSGGFPDATDAGDTPGTDGGPTGEVAPTVLPFAVDDWSCPPTTATCRARRAPRAWTAAT